MAQQLVESVGLAVAPEIEAPALLVQHAGGIAIGVLIVFAILFIIIGIIVVSAKKTTAGVLLMMLGLLMGAGGVYLRRQPRKP